jgi:hypothetical protein
MKSDGKKSPQLNNQLGRFLVRVVIQDFLKNPVISMVSGLAE